MYILTSSLSASHRAILEIITSYYFVRYYHVLVSHFSEDLVKINRTSKQIAASRLLTRISKLKNDSFQHYIQAIARTFRQKLLKTILSLSTFKITIRTDEKRRIVQNIQYRSTRNDVSFKSFSIYQKRRVVQISQYKCVKES